MMAKSNDSLTKAFEDLLTSAGNGSLLNDLMSNTISPTTTLTLSQSSKKMDVSEFLNHSYEWTPDQHNQDHECCKCVKEYLVHAQDTKDGIIKKGNNFHFCDLDEHTRCTGSTKIDTWCRSVKSRKTIKSQTSRKAQNRLKVNLDIWQPAGLEIRLQDVCFSDVTLTKKYQYIEPKLRYQKGNLVWVKMQGYPTWPGMVDDDPDNETYYWVLKENPQKVHYHVVFFDEPKHLSRAWRPEECLRLFNFNPRVSFRSMSLFKRFQIAFNEAKKAENLSLQVRIEKYSFVNRMKQSDVILIED